MNTPLSPHLYFGLDLGLRQDHAALAILQRSHRNTHILDPITREWTWELRFLLRHVERFPLGTPYLTIVERIRRLFHDLDLGIFPRLLPDRWPVEPGHLQAPHRTLVIDASGVGTPVLELLRRAELHGRITPITITSGSAPSSDSATGGYLVPRRDLVSTLRILLELGCLKIPANMHHRKELFDELARLTDRSTRHHDDLAIATALAAWVASQSVKLGPRP